MTPVGSSTRRSGRILLTLLAATVLLPGVLLVALGVRTLRQERRLQDQQLRERVEGMADLVVHELDAQVRAWETAVAELPQRGFDRTTLPRELRAAVAAPGVAVVISASGDA